MDAKQYKDGDFFEITGSVFKNIKESWEAVKLNLVTFILLYLIPSLLTFLAIPLILLPILAGSDSGSAAGFIIAALFFAVIFVIWLTILPAITITQLASVRGQKIEFQDAFNKGKPFVLRYVGLGILSVIAITIGFIFLIIPGLIAIFLLAFAPLLLIDKNLGIIDAMKESANLAQEYWKPVLAIFLVFVVISIPGYVPFIGQLASAALGIAYFCLQAVIYVRLVAKKPAK